MTGIVSMSYGLPLEYTTPFLQRFPPPSRNDHLPTGCHFVFPAFSPYKFQPPSFEERSILSRPKYPPYVPFIGGVPSSSFPTVKSLKPHNSREALDYSTCRLYMNDSSVCPAWCPLNHGRASFRRSAGNPELFRWLLSNENLPSDDRFSFGLRLSSLANRRFSTFSRHHESIKRPAAKRFQCPHCDKSFGKSSHLRDHIRTHTGDRPYKCEFCEKAFTQYSNLRTHTRIHTGEKPYRCARCNKSFTQAVTLRTHIKTHDGDKSCGRTECKQPYPCFTNARGHEIPQARETSPSREICHGRSRWDESETSLARETPSPRKTLRPHEGEKFLDDGLLPAIKQECA